MLRHNTDHLTFSNGRSAPKLLHFPTLPRESSLFIFDLGRRELWGDRGLLPGNKGGAGGAHCWFMVRADQRFYLLWTLLLSCTGGKLWTESVCEWFSPPPSQTFCKINVMIKGMMKIKTCLFCMELYWFPFRLLRPLIIHHMKDSLREKSLVSALLIKQLSFFH